MSNSSSRTGAEQSFGSDNTPYDALGGEARVRELAEAFYDHMDADPRFAQVRQLHPEDLTQSREKFHMFLSGWLGGPPLYERVHGHPKLRARHMPFAIGVVERDQWLQCMSMAMDQLRIEGPIRDFLDERFAHVADFMRNQ